MESTSYEFFGRKMSVLVGNDDTSFVISEKKREHTSGFANLKMTAKIVKDSKQGEDDFCELSIYNLKQSSRELMNLQNLRLVLTAGYGENLGIAFTGDIQSATHIKENQDWVTTLIASDGGKALDQSIVNKTYKKGTSLQDIMIDYQNIAKIPELSMLDLDVDKVLERGKSVNMPVRDAISELATSNNFDWSIQDGSLIAVKVESSRATQRVVVSAQTGMINSPEWMNTGTDNSKVNSETGITLKVVSLCQVSIRPFDKIFVKSQALTATIGSVSVASNPTELIGEFKVTKITHEIDSFDGDFKSTIECQQTGADFVSPETFDVSQLIQNAKVS